jgi:acyl-CoA thioesterase FadM
MMKLYARSLPALWRGATGASIPPDATLATRFRVLPHDIDLNGHLNNGRHFQLMDLARVEWLLRTGIARQLLRRRWRPVLASSAIHFRRELNLWEQATATTRLLGWEGHWVYLEHAILTGTGRQSALGLVRAGFRDGGAWVPIDRLAEALPHKLAPPPLPPQVTAWQGLDNVFAGLIGRPVPA